MNSLIKYQHIIDILNDHLSCKAHDLQHTYRVYEMAMIIAKSENLNEDSVEILTLSSLLHDIARAKEKDMNIDHALYGADMSRDILKSFNYSNDIIDKVHHAISTHRYRNELAPDTIEAKILFDADKIDVLGAIGIGRLFAFSATHDQDIYFIPDDIEEYKANNLNKNGRISNVKKHSPYIEYIAKCKNLPNSLHTVKGKELAMNRLNIMDIFFDELSKELSLYKG